MSLGILNVCFDCVYARAHLDHNMYNEGKDKIEIYTENKKAQSARSARHLTSDRRGISNARCRVMCVGKMREQG
jgi:hypothetical protein